MLKPLVSYLTDVEKSYREFAKFALSQSDWEKYKILEEEIDYIPDEYTFVGGIFIYRNNLVKILNSVLYCKIFYCGETNLEFFPDLPYCEYLDCNRNKLKELPSLPLCKNLYCSENKLKELPSLPLCEELVCRDNKLTELPSLSRCTYLDCSGNKLTSLPSLPVCKYLYCKGNDIKDFSMVNPFCEIINE